MYNVYEIRKQFPMLQNKTMQNHPLVYLDNAATTFKPQCVIDAVNNYYNNMTSNAHRGDYDLMYNVDLVMNHTREDIAKFIECEQNEVVFTSGDTMSLNMIAFGYGSKFLKPGDEILISEEEHASNVLPWFRVAELTGAKVKYVRLTKSGLITVDNFKKSISTKTKIVALAHVGNVLGYEVDIKSIAKIAHEYGAIMVVDGAQSVPHIKTHFKDWDIDFLTFSGHKMCAPTGIGCLIGKYGLLCAMDSIFIGGGDNIDFYKNYDYELLPPPAKFETGTLDIAAVFGFQAAIKFLSDLGMDNVRNHEIKIHKYLTKRLKEVPNMIVYNKKCNASILTFNMQGIFPQDEATLLNSKGIAARSGKHCAKLLTKFLKVPGTVRISTYLYTCKEDIDVFIDALKNGGDILDAYFN